MTYSIRASLEIRASYKRGSTDLSSTLLTVLGGTYQTELRKVELPVVDRTDCQNRLRTTRLGSYFQLHSSFICAGGEANRDTCTGDGGGPLVYLTANGQYFQVVG